MVLMFCRLYQVAEYNVAKAKELVNFNPYVVSVWLYSRLGVTTGCYALQNGILLKKIT